MSVNDLKLLDNLEWENKVINHWEIGESFAEKQMNNFFKEGLGDYSTEEISQTNLMYQEYHHIFIGDKFLQTHFGIS